MLFLGLLLAAAWGSGGSEARLLYGIPDHDYQDLLGRTRSGGEIEMTDSKFLVLGGGCFWCTEAVYERVEGVRAVISGYAGGTVAKPSYQEVTGGNTGHAEVIRIEYDPSRVSFKELVDLFWYAHDPTTLNRQGADIGPQYRSIIFYADAEEEAIIRESLKEAQEYYDDPIVTQLETLAPFYPAENYHQDYFANNPLAGYCQLVIAPKLKKLGIYDVQQIAIPDMAVIPGK